MSRVSTHFLSYGVGKAAVMAIACAAAYQDPEAIAAPCVQANKPPATGPAAAKPANPKIAGEPNTNPVTIIGAATIAVNNPIL